MLYLDAFRQIGGIEKFNKAFMKALYDISKDGEIHYKAFSVCDDKPDTRYIKVEKHKGFRNRKYSFAINAFLEGLKSDLVVIGHLNLASIGLLIKIFKPKKKMILVAHGLEVWEKQNILESRFIEKVDLILAVSNFTRNNILENNEVLPEKVVIFHNTLDPYFIIPEKNEKPEYLLNRYGLTTRNKIILTITRVNKLEEYKGYDKVLEALPDIIKEVPEVMYILGGKYGPVEEARIKNLVKAYKLEQHFILAGFIEEKELTDHYLLADVFIMPSTKEGFGIVFIEAAACGVPIIAGNKDGSTDALINGKVGKLIEPDNIDEIAESVITRLKIPSINYKNLVIENFGFDEFKKRLRTVLFDN